MQETEQNEEGITVHRKLVVLRGIHILAIISTYPLKGKEVVDSVPERRCVEGELLKKE